jgi:hypothetical protein
VRCVVGGLRSGGLRSEAGSSHKISRPHLTWEISMGPPREADFSLVTWPGDICANTAREEEEGGPC